MASRLLFALTFVLVLCRSAAAQYSMNAWTTAAGDISPTSADGQGV